VDLTGIFAFKAMTLAGKPTLDIQAAGEEEGRLTVALADQIRADGIPLVDVSAGSTPTAAVIAAQPGITEIRPGTYVFNDMATVGSGACQLTDCAAGVLVTVVSSNGRDRLVVDGGCKTFSRTASQVRRRSVWRIRPDSGRRAAGLQPHDGRTRHDARQTGRQRPPGRRPAAGYSQPYLHDRQLASAGRADPKPQ
jgi:D-serine deaminase-like pyridoxal phosphate-dependent protein